MCSRVLNKHIEREAAGSNHLQHTNICNIHSGKVCMEGTDTFLSKKSFMFQGFIYFGKLNVNVKIVLFLESNPNITCHAHFGNVFFKMGVCLLAKTGRM